MIASVSIQSLRGIREGALEGMTPLTVLVGPNSSGKSTILRREAQVVLTTCSIELIDALLHHLRPDELGLLSLYRLTLDDGVLVTSRLDGAQVRLARGDLEDDLR